MMKWLTWLQLDCNQTVSVSLIYLAKTGKINDRQKWKGLLFLVDIPQRSILNSGRPPSVATNQFNSKSFEKVFSIYNSGIEIVFFWKLLSKNKPSWHPTAIKKRVTVPPSLEQGRKEPIDWNDRTLESRLCWEVKSTDSHWPTHTGQNVSSCFFFFIELWVFD